MLNFLKWFFGLFSRYVNPLEKKVDKFFNKLSADKNRARVQQDLLKLMQKNLIVLNIWLEKKFKAYRYLDKATRRKMYRDSEKIRQFFENFSKKNPTRLEEVKESLALAGCGFPNGDEEKIKYLYEIMKFLSPGKYYHYIETSSFGKLIRDPATQKLEGDCNQIVTLYAYLFSLKFPLQELKIKILPGHVCLHFREIDIEATSASFAKYRDYQDVLPITEIISTNLLDLSDFRERSEIISHKTVLKSAELAYSISSMRSVVEKNLNIAYRNLAAVAYNSENYSEALFYARKLGDAKLIDVIEKADFANKYNALAKKVRDVKTLEDARKNKSTYNKMLVLARKLRNSKLEKNIRDILRKI